MEHYNLSEEVWSKLFSRLNEFSGIYSRNALKIRKFIEGVFWILRTGAQWKALPAVYGHWRSIHKRFDAWSGKGIWSALFESFTVDHDGEWIMLDSTIVRAHPCAAAYEKNGSDKHSLGRSKGGFYHKNPCFGRCAWKSFTVLSYSRATPRYHPSSLFNPRVW